MSPQLNKPGLLLSLALLVLAFAADRLHKFLQVSWDCVQVGAARCIDYSLVPSPSLANWTGGEQVPVTPFFDYVLAWNTGISYGLFGSFPVTRQDARRVTARQTSSRGSSSPASPESAP